MSSGEAGSLIAARGPKVVSAVWRLGTPADMAGAALFLASPLAYIVGQTIVVGGGPDTFSELDELQGLSQSLELTEFYRRRNLFGLGSLSRRWRDVQCANLYSA